MSEIKPTKLTYKLGDDAELIFESKEGSDSATEDYITVSEIDNIGNQAVLNEKEASQLLNVLTTLKEQGYIK